MSICIYRPLIFVAALRSRYGYYIFIVVSSTFLLLSLFFSSLNLSRRRLDVYHTSTHGVALVRIWDTGLKRAARSWLKIQDAQIAIHVPSNNFVGLYFFATSQLRHLSTIGKKLLNSSMSSTCPYNMVNFGPLTAETVSGVWSTPANFNAFSVLAALLHGTPVVGVSQTLWR